MHHSLLQAAVVGLALSGTAITAVGAAIDSVTVTPTRPTENALITWDATASPHAGKQNNWVSWSRSSGVLSSPGQSFLMPQTGLVTGIALQLNSTLTSETIVRNTNGAPITLALETYTSGNSISPTGTVSALAGNLPSNFDDNATNYGQWVTFTFDAPVELEGGNYYGLRLDFNDANDPAREVKFNTGYWGDGGATSIDGRPGNWIGNTYAAWDWQSQPGVEDLQFVVIGTVPEPASLGLLASGAALLLRRRRQGVAE